MRIVVALVEHPWFRLSSEKQQTFYFLTLTKKLNGAVFPHIGYPVLNLVNLNNKIR